MNKAIKTLFQIEAAALVGLTLLVAPAFAQQGLQSAATRNANAKKAAIASGQASTAGTTKDGVNTGSLYSQKPSLANLYAGPAPQQPAPAPSSAPPNGVQAPADNTALLPADSDLFRWNPVTGNYSSYFFFGRPAAVVGIGGRGPWGGFVGKGFLAPLPRFVYNSQLGYTGGARRPSGGGGKSGGHAPTHGGGKK